MKPMLARPYKAELIKFPGFVQPKLNGLRALWEFGGNEGLWSRDQHKWKAEVVPNVYSSLKSEATLTVLEYVREALRPHSFLGLDGELYCHGMSLQQINSRGAVNRVTAHKEHYMLSFHVFDLISPAPMLQRSEAMKLLELVAIPAVVAVPTVYCGNEQTFQGLYDLYYGKERYEGIMWRDPKAGYGFSIQCSNKENRWNHIVKKKPRLDMNVMIRGVVEQDGEERGLAGSFECVTGHGVPFSVGSGLDKPTRRALWEVWCENPQLFIGHSMRIDYEVLSDGMVPLKPTIACVNIPVDV